MTSYVYYFISVPPQISPFDFDEEPINSGDVVSLACSVNKGDLPLNISWEFNGTSLRDLYGVTTNMVNKRLSTLSIESVQADNAGEYKCISKNLAGYAEHAAYLYVNGTYVCSSYIIVFIMHNFSPNPHCPINKNYLYCC